MTEIKINKSMENLKEKSHLGYTGQYCAYSAFCKPVLTKSYFFLSLLEAQHADLRLV